MSLIKCPECQKEISDQALSCPHCGYPLKKKVEEAHYQLDIDPSNLEVIAYRGVAKSVKAMGFVIPIVCLAILIGVLIMMFTIGRDVLPLAIVLGVICVPASVVAIVFFVLSAVKFHNNDNLKYHNLYYDKEKHYFYSQLWNKRIIKIDARKDIRMGYNRNGYNESILIVDGHKLNTGFSIENLNSVNSRIAEIKSELE